LSYNQKIAQFYRVQRDLRHLWQTFARPSLAQTLDAEMMVVMPNCLCSTFGFHPMLGFRRSRQAASIAHGCAATFATIASTVLGRTPGTGTTWPAGSA
jgi:hypothetical protein